MNTWQRLVKSFMDFGFSCLNHIMAGPDSVVEKALHDRASLLVSIAIFYWNWYRWSTGSDEPSKDCMVGTTKSFGLGSSEIHSVKGD